MTLIEALIAASLLVVLVSGLAYLTLLARHFSTRAEEALMATAAASARLESLRAVPWEYGAGGVALEAPALNLSPPDALDRNADGYSDRLDASGRPVGDAAAGEPAFVRRWAVTPASVAADDVRAIEVCVFAWPAAEGAFPLACLTSVRARQP